MGEPPNRWVCALQHNMDDWENPESETQNLPPASACRLQAAIGGPAQLSRQFQDLFGDIQFIDVNIRLATVVKNMLFFFFDFFGWIGATVSTQKRCFRHLCLERPQETCKIRRGSIGSINLSPIDGKRWKKLENHGKIHHRSRFGSLGTSLNCSWWIQEAMFEDTGGYFQRNVFARMDGIDGWMTRWII